VLVALPVAVTAVLAAPLHRRLVRRDEEALTRLLGVDKARTVLALAAVAVTIVAIVR